MAFGVLTIILSALTGIVAIDNGGAVPVWYLILGILTCVSYCKRDDKNGKGRVGFALCVYIFGIVTLLVDWALYAVFYAAFAVVVAFTHGSSEAEELYGWFIFTSLYMIFRLWQTMCAFWFYASLRDDQSA